MSKRKSNVPISAIEWFEKTAIDESEKKELKK